MMNFPHTNKNNSQITVTSFINQINALKKQLPENLRIFSGLTGELMKFHVQHFPVFHSLEQVLRLCGRSRLRINKALFAVSP